jgi:murein DD-endopeptidase MepM/ murein hydrolase activator NlpD
MSVEKNSHHHKEPHRYTLVLVPSDQSKKTRTFSLGVLGFASIVTTLCLVTVGITLAVLIYTPVGPLVPIPNPELERLYGKRIVEIQEQVSGLFNEMVQLRRYNLHLRRALGENITVEDSALMVQSGVQKTPAVAAILADTAKRTHLIESFSEMKSSGERTMELISARDHRETRQAQSGEEPFPMMMPSTGYFTRGIDEQNNHFGVDIAGKEGTLVIAAAPGNIIFADWTYDDGYKMIIAHSDGYVTVYKHNQALMKKVGASVKRGEPIALMGSTGRMSSGTHLHFEVWKDGVVRNPDNYLVTVQ